MNINGSKTDRDTFKDDSREHSISSTNAARSQLKSQKTILVTGGGGFLGSAIVRDLLVEGYKVRSFSRKLYPELEALGVTCHVGDIANPMDVDPAVKGVDGVIHGAAYASVWGRYEDFFNTNVVGTRNVIGAMKKFGIKHLVYTSSPSIVFDGKSIEGDDESIPYAKKDLAFYPATKKIAEKEVRSAVGHDFFAVSLRPHLIWGPHDPHFFPRLKWKARTGKLKQVGDGTNRVDTIFVTNAARAHRLALEALFENPSLSGRAYFLGQETNRLCWEFVADLVKASGSKPVSGKIPLWLAYGVGALFEFLYRTFGIFDREPPITKLVALQLAKSHYFSHANAHRDFGYKPLVTYEEGMLALKEWAKTQP
jgi:nucleoside-diphosphate-sugar epimerase